MPSIAGRLLVSRASPGTHRGCGVYLARGTRRALIQRGMVNSAKRCSEDEPYGVGAEDIVAERDRSALRQEALAEASDGLRDRLRRYEVKLILEALEASRGNQTEAARRLKVPLRMLAHKMKMLGIRRRGYEAGP